MNNLTEHEEWIVANRMGPDVGVHSLAAIIKRLDAELTQAISSYDRLNAQPPVRTDAEIVAQTEALADKFAAMDGWRRISDRPWHASTNPRSMRYWKQACLAQEVLTNTDVDNAVAGLQEAWEDS